MKKEIINLSCALLEEVLNRFGVSVTADPRSPMNVLLSVVQRRYKDCRPHLGSRRNLPPMQLLMGEDEDTDPHNALLQVTCGKPGRLYSRRYSLDHICPLSEAQSVKEVALLSHWRNLRVVTVEDNLNKSDHLTEEGRELRKILLGR